MKLVVSPRPHYNTLKTPVQYFRLGPRLKFLGDGRTRQCSLYVDGVPVTRSPGVHLRVRCTPTSPVFTVDSSPKVGGVFGPYTPHGRTQGVSSVDGGLVVTSQRQVRALLSSWWVDSGRVKD